MAQTPPVYDPESFWNRRLGRELSLASVGHAGVGLAFNRWAYRVRRQATRRALREQGIELRGATGLELAFGTGFYLDLWRELGVAHVTGFDIAGVAVRAARERFAGLTWRLEKGDIGGPLDLGPAAGRCDFATAMDVLFHLVDDAAWHGALDNLATALRPGGHGLLTDKFRAQPRVRTHVKHRSLDEYQTALAARGLEVRAIRPVFFFMNSPAELRGASRAFFETGWSLAKLPYKLGRRLGLGEALGGAAGACCYLPERALGRLCARGPSTELLIARKRG